jgi:hypothetical protein
MQYKHKTSGGEYRLIGRFSRANTKGDKMIFCSPAGTLKEETHMTIMLTTHGYGYLQGADFGELIFYEGCAGCYARYPDDFEEKFELVAPAGVKYSF